MLDIQQIDLELVREILARTVLREARVVLFGSRVKGRAKRGSDLDVAVDMGRPLTLRERGQLENDFSESLLPYVVDVLDLRTAEDWFCEIVEREAVPFPNWNTATQRDSLGSRDGGGTGEP
jgi:predicted nucleotidyltransferase